MKIELYTKSNCPLCEKARLVLENVEADHPFQLVEIDITQSEELYQKYKNLIPVLKIDGKKEFSGAITEDELRKYFYFG